MPECAACGQVLDEQTAILSRFCDSTCCDIAEVMAEECCSYHTARMMVVRGSDDEED